MRPVAGTDAATPVPLSSDAESPSGGRYELSEHRKWFGDRGAHTRARARRSRARQDAAANHQRKGGDVPTEPANEMFFVEQAQPEADPQISPSTPPAPAEAPPVAAAPEPAPEPPPAPAPPPAAVEPTVLPATSMVDVPLGTLIIRAGLLAEEQLEEALQEVMRTGKRLGEVLLERGWIAEKDLGRMLAGQKDLPLRRGHSLGRPARGAAGSARRERPPPGRAAASLRRRPARRRGRRSVERARDREPAPTARLPSRSSSSHRTESFSRRSERPTQRSMPRGRRPLRLPSPLGSASRPRQSLVSLPLLPLSRSRLPRRDPAGAGARGSARSRSVAQSARFDPAGSSGRRRPEPGARSGRDARGSCHRGRSGAGPAGYSGDHTGRRDACSGRGRGAARPGRGPSASRTRRARAARGPSAPAPPRSPPSRLRSSIRSRPSPLRRHQPSRQSRKPRTSRSCSGSRAAKRSRSERSQAPPRHPPAPRKSFARSRRRTSRARGRSSRIASSGRTRSSRSISSRPRPNSAPVPVASVS